jgi:hypothetical protein
MQGNEEEETAEKGKSKARRLTNASMAGMLTN